MSENTFHAFTRRAAAGVNRRASLVALGVATLATLPLPFTVGAKKNKRKKKNKSARKAKKQCQQDLGECTAQAALCAGQVEPCTATFTNLCAGHPACTSQILCCQYLATCDVNTFFACTVAAGLGA